MTVIIFIIILAVLILVHEFGHFIVAKKLGIRVDEFGIGFPPRVFGFKPKNGETTYSINAIPFGGFVKIFGETPGQDSISGPESHRSFVNKPKWIQTVVLSAGVLFNIIFAWILISVSLLSGLPAVVSENNVGVIENSRILILEVLPNSPAGLAGLKIGDEIISAKAGSITLFDKKLTITSLENLIANSDDFGVGITYKRNEYVENITIKPLSGIVEGKQAIGISMNTIGIIKTPIYKVPLEALKLTYRIIEEIILNVSKLIQGIFTGEANLLSVAGPIGIIGLVGSAWNFGFVNLLMFVAFISINLAILNMIPFPALDGGRILFILIEKIKGSNIKPKIANAINMVGFFLLIALMIAVTYNDIGRLFK